MNAKTTKPELLTRRGALSGFVALTAAGSGLLAGRAAANPLVVVAGIEGAEALGPAVGALMAFGRWVAGRLVDWAGSAAVAASVELWERQYNHARFIDVHEAALRKVLEAHRLSPASTSDIAETRRDFELALAFVHQYNNDNTDRRALEEAKIVCTRLVEYLKPNRFSTAGSASFFNAQALQISCLQEIFNLDNPGWQRTLDRWSGPLPKFGNDGQLRTMGQAIVAAENYRSSWRLQAARALSQRITRAHCSARGAPIGSTLCFYVDGKYREVAGYRSPRDELWRADYLPFQLYADEMIASWRKLRIFLAK